ncbi:hypothetical protein Tco_0007495 [Tanacetum coccineum]
MVKGVMIEGVWWTDPVQVDKDASVEEIKNAVWDCRSSKAPSLNGFSFLFLKMYWDFLKDDVVEFVSSFLTSSQISLGRCRGVKIKEWFQASKQWEESHGQRIRNRLNDLDQKLDMNVATDLEREERLKLLQECEDLDRILGMDLAQKAHSHWDIEWDENTKYFHGLINQRRRQQMVKGVMIEGVWCSDPVQVKQAFFDFFKHKFQDHESNVVLTDILNFSRLSDLDQLQLDKDASVEEIKNAVD